MHIALYSPNWPPGGAANGIVTYVDTFREYLLNQGHKVSVLSNARLYSADGPGIPLMKPNDGARGMEQLKRRICGRIDRWHGGMPCLGRLIAAQVQAAHRIDPIDVFEMEESFGWSRAVSRSTRIPVVTRLHGPHFLHPTANLSAREALASLQKCRTEARAVRTTRTLTAPTRAILEATCQTYGRSLGQNDWVIPNPIRMPPENGQWSLSECDRNHILMVGRFDYRKGADTMLLAFDKVLQSRPAARLTLVGPNDGFQWGSSGRTLTFEEFAQAHLSPTAASRVTMTGTLGAEEIARLRQNAFVTVVASRFESFSYALLEGLAAGSPMLSTAWPASKEIITDGESGFLTPVADPEAMAARLCWLMDNPEIAASVGANGRQHGANTFSTAAVGKQLVDCFEATIRSAGA